MLGIIFVNTVLATLVVIIVTSLLARGFQSAEGALKLYDPLKQGAKGPKLLPEIHPPVDPHHPQLPIPVQTLG